MNKRFHFYSLLLVLSSILLSPLALAQTKPITIYWDGYSADHAMSVVAKDLIESHYHIPVKLKMVSVGACFLGVAHDKRTLFLAAWLPTTHKAYMKKVAGKVRDLGVIYDGARIGWVVPDYVPKDQLNSITDLKKPSVAKKLHDKIQGISAGAGETQRSKVALKDYGLSNYNLVTASGAAMTAALKRAIDHKQWIVVTGWSPHWMWGRYKLRYLKDPKNSLGKSEHVDAIANKDFYKDVPKVYDFISRTRYSLSQVNTMLANANKTSYKAAANHFIKTHPKLVNYWTTGKE